MKKLKSDVWRTVDKECPRTTDSTDANQPSSTPNKKSKISFHDVIADISQSPHSQKEASLSFYFICLLHLANENVRNSMSFFVIFSLILFTFYINFDCIVCL